ncbi:MAG: hypothetical protein ABSB76_05360 [Streptosporangiaceae bacterium]|jgi:hypothetical protein
MGSGFLQIGVCGAVWQNRRSGRGTGRGTLADVPRLATFPQVSACRANAAHVPRYHGRAARLRHASAKTTLDTYGHLWPDRDESTRAAVEAVFSARADSLRTVAAEL